MSTHTHHLQWGREIVTLITSVTLVRLGLAYAGSAREDVIEVLTPVMWDGNSSLEVRMTEEDQDFCQCVQIEHYPPSQVVCLGALSCALIAVGSCHGDLTENFLQLMMDREPGELTCTHIRFLALALALLYLGKQKAMEATMAALKAVSEPLSTFASTLLEICAYAGTWCVSHKMIS